MSAGFDVYVPGRSWLHRADPRVKLALSLALVVVLLLWTSLPLIALTLVAVQLALLSAGFGSARLVRIWRALAPFLVLIAVLWPLFDRSGAPVLLHAGPLIITGEAIASGVAAALRIAAITFAATLWIGTTDQHDLVRTFVRLGLPFRLGMALTIGLRFIPTFAGIFQTVAEAQQSRGLVLAGRGWRRARAMIPILIPALVTALRMSDQLGWTLEARAFGAPVRRTTLRDIAMRPGDWLLLAGVALAGVALLVLTLAGHVGRALWYPFMVYVQ